MTQLRWPKIWRCPLLALEQLAGAQTTGAYAALSLDAVDASGEQGGDISLAKNGELHKIRLSADGSKLAVEEYVAPKHFGFMLRKPRAVLPHFLSRPQTRR